MFNDVKLNKNKIYKNIMTDKNDKNDNMNIKKEINKNT